MIFSASLLYPSGVRWTGSDPQILASSFLLVLSSRPMALLTHMTMYSVILLPCARSSSQEWIWASEFPISVAQSLVPKLVRWSWSLQHLPCTYLGSADRIILRLLPAALRRVALRLKIFFRAVHSARTSSPKMW